MEAIKEIGYHSTKFSTQEQINDAMCEKIDEIIGQVNKMAKTPKPILVVKIPHQTMQSYERAKESLGKAVDKDEYHQLVISSPNQTEVEITVLNPIDADETSIAKLQDLITKSLQ